MSKFVTRGGEKLYPVCSWEKNQHKLYNALDKAYIRREEENSDEADEWVEKVEKALDTFNRVVIGGTVYATYQDAAFIKELVTAYDVRGDMAGFWKENNAL